ncbi:MAG: hypothetical protein AWM53_01277 [Candidatus Dichloromethanomonas elyunquensis]|nr:MAG: hypothetical protein AWM53_01277 [Candidatus Dichloromethanomonas elyunquensis]
MRKRNDQNNQNESEVKRTNRSKFLRTIGVWTLVSLLLQLGFYFALNQAVAKMMMAASPNLKAIAATYEGILPDTRPENIQVSYAKDYLAYMSNGTFKVFNVKQNKVVFSKSREAGSDAEMGVLNYQWLPDRNTLIYFFAKKNPNPYKTVTETESTASKTTQNPEDPNPKPAASKDSNGANGSAGTTSTSGTNGSAAAKESAAPKNSAVDKETNGTTEKPKEITIYQPQLTELHSLELPNSSEDTKPDERQNMMISDFPAGGKITRVASSTYTNMIYLLVQSGASMKLMQIDIMQDVTVLQRADETVMNITASDRNGTLYFESKTGTAKQILALDSTKRKTVSAFSNYTILGDCAGTLYIGEMKNNKLVKILTAKDSSEKDRPIELFPIWQGDIPFSKGQVGLDSRGKITIFENNTAYIIMNGELNTKAVTGQENYISHDGAVFIQLTHQTNGTKVNIKPV